MTDESRTTQIKAGLALLNEAFADAYEEIELRIDRLVRDEKARHKLRMTELQEARRRLLLECRDAFRAQKAAASL